MKTALTPARLAGSRSTPHLAHRGTGSRGLTLVETAVALAIGAIVLAAAMPGMQASIERRRLDGAAAELAADLRHARSEAIARNRPVRVSFHSHAGISCYLIHTGTAARCTCAAARPACDSGAALVRGVVTDRAGGGIAVRANVSSIAFDPLHGTATPAGTVQVVAGSGDAVHHVVNVLGRVRSCSPGGAVPGWPSC